ncbi:WD repeat-containing protein 43 [Trichonephila inaurata madagascariensis]|uniref:WD repeat-containing protein 43 n=1 Tax=Trichonephila inaurata madagascariensis TaxID=2747483 RepID=A0A8X6YPF1_9ARAC|nr:WD repeat-containing protein 43 [Trichonephila inaurata madagascariensis]
MLSSRNILAFSDHGEYLAYSLPDGRLKIWETSTGVLKQEFVPSSHLSATCKSLSWGPTKRNSLLAKRPKKSTNEALSIEDLQLIAMGTIPGDILLYSFSKADLHSCLVKDQFYANFCILPLEHCTYVYNVPSERSGRKRNNLTGQGFLSS